MSRNPGHQHALTSVTAYSELMASQLDRIVAGTAGASLDIEQVLNIGSQSSGAGGGKITLSPFSTGRAAS